MNMTSTVHTHLSSGVCLACYTDGFQEGMDALLLILEQKGYIMSMDASRVRTAMSEAYSTAARKDT